MVASRNLVIRMPEPACRRQWRNHSLALIPGFCVLAVVLALRLAVEASPFGDINSMIATLIGIPMHHVGGTLPGMIISVILIGILWTLASLHGDAIVLVFIQPVWLSNKCPRTRRPSRTVSRSRISLLSSFTICGLPPGVPARCWGW